MRTNKLVPSNNNNIGHVIEIIVSDTIYAPPRHNHKTEPFKVEMHDAIYFIIYRYLIISIYKREMELSKMSYDTEYHSVLQGLFLPIY